MKNIILGIKDYCKDCWHDWLVARLKKFCCAIYDYVPARHKDLVAGYLEPAMTWKEGSVWHYIRQRKLAKKGVKNG